MNGLLSLYKDCSVENRREMRISQSIIVLPSGAAWNVEQHEENGDIDEAARRTIAGQWSR